MSATVYLISVVDKDGNHLPIALHRTREGMLAKLEKLNDPTRVKARGGIL